MNNGALLDPSWLRILELIVASKKISVSFLANFRLVAELALHSAAPFAALGPGQ